MMVMLIDVRHAGQRFPPVGLMSVYVVSFVISSVVFRMTIPATLMSAVLCPNSSANQLCGH